MKEKRDVPASDGLRVPSTGARALVASLLLVALAAPTAVAAKTPASTTPGPTASKALVWILPGVPVTCDGSIDGLYGGLTYPDGHIVLAGYVCAGLSLYEIPERGRLQAAHRLRLVKDPDWYIGVGLLVAFHEAQHALDGTEDETDAECAAVANLRWYLTRWQLSYALTFDAALPAAYHAHPCTER